AAFRSVPLRTLLRRVFARVELELELVYTFDLLELRFHHLHRLQCSYPARNPLWASSSVSVATWFAPMSSEGQFHLPGSTPSSFQVAIGLPSVSRRGISARSRLTRTLTAP